MHVPTWPDPLQKPEASRIQQCLGDFWQTLSGLSELIQRNEHLLANEQTETLRKIILEMMLALNGIQRPQGTLHLNSYLGESQRHALEKTLIAPSVSGESWIGRAVALVVIYRWYAPQLVEKYRLDYPHEAEAEALQRLQCQLPDWPLEINTH
ncbi:MAG: aminoglycoside 6-adenylyltransferase [Caldilineaceae bacterium]